MGRRRGLLQGKALYFVYKFFDIAEFTVDGGEADVGHFIQLAKATHYFLANSGGGDFAIVQLGQFVDHFIHKSIDDLEPQRPFFAGFGNAGMYLAAIERFVSAVALDNTKVFGLNFLVRRKAMGTLQALAAATNNSAVFARAGIYHLIFQVNALGALHTTSSG
jgi:hypothetical protein